MISDNSSDRDFLDTKSQVDDLSTILTKETSTRKTYRKYKRIEQVKEFLDNPKSAYSLAYHSIVGLILIASIFSSYYLFRSVYLDYVIFPILLTETLMRTIIGCSVVKNRLRYFFNFWMIIDYVIVTYHALLIIILHLFDKSTTSFRVLYAIQVIKLFHIDRHIKFTTLLLSTFRKYGKELIPAYCLSLFAIFPIAYVIHYIESPTLPNMDLPTSLYLSVCTFLTIGYGDESPKTYYGRLVLTLVAFFGVTLSSIPAVILGSGLAISLKKKKKHNSQELLENSACIFIQRLVRFHDSLKEKYVLIDSNNPHPCLTDNLAELTQQNSKNRHNLSDVLKVHQRESSPLTHQNTTLHPQGHAHKMVIISLKKCGTNICWQTNNCRITTIVVRTIFKMLKMTAMKKFLIHTGIIKEQDEIKFLITAVTTLSLSLGKLLIEKNEIRKENDEIDKDLMKLSKDISDVAMLSNEITTIRENIQHIHQEL